MLNQPRNQVKIHQSWLDWSISKYYLWMCLLELPMAMFSRGIVLYHAITPVRRSLEGDHACELWLKEEKFALARITAHITTVM